MARQVPAHWTVRERLSRLLGLHSGDCIIGRAPSQRTTSVPSSDERRIIQPKPVFDFDDVVMLARDDTDERDSYQFTTGRRGDGATTGIGKLWRMRLVNLVTVGGHAFAEPCVAVDPSIFDRTSSRTHVTRSSGPSTSFVTLRDTT